MKSGGIINPIAIPKEFANILLVVAKKRDSALYQLLDNFVKQLITKAFPQPAMT